MKRILIVVCIVVFAITGYFVIRNITSGDKSNTSSDGGNSDFDMNISGNEKRDVLSGTNWMLENEERYTGFYFMEDGGFEHWNILKGTEFAYIPGSLDEYSVSGDKVLVKFLPPGNIEKFEYIFQIKGNLLILGHEDYPGQKFECKRINKSPEEYRNWLYETNE